jgi:hypothetical protein
MLNRRGLYATRQRPVYEYRLRDLEIDQPNQIWCADIPYIPMRRGFPYLAVKILSIARGVTAVYACRRQYAFHPISPVWCICRRTQNKRVWQRDETENSIIPGRLPIWPGETFTFGIALTLLHPWSRATFSSRVRACRGGRLRGLPLPRPLPEQRPGRRSFGVRLLQEHPQRIVHSAGAVAAVAGKASGGRG